MEQTFQHFYLGAMHLVFVHIYFHFIQVHVFPIFVFFLHY